MSNKTKVIIGAGVLALLGIYLYLKKGIKGTSTTTSVTPNPTPTPTPTPTTPSEPVVSTITPDATPTTTTNDGGGSSYTYNKDAAAKAAADRAAAKKAADDLAAQRATQAQEQKQAEALKQAQVLADKAAADKAIADKAAEPTMQILTDKDRAQSFQMKDQKNELSKDPLGLNTFETAFQIVRITTDSKGDYMERGDATTLYNKGGEVIGNLNDYSGFFEDSNGRAIATSDGTSVAYNDVNGNYIERGDATTLYNNNGDVIGNLNQETGNYEDENGNVVDLSINNAGSGSTTNDAYGITTTNIFANDSFGGGFGGGGYNEGWGLNPFQTLS